MKDPFRYSIWRGELAAAAEALWAWHDFIRDKPLSEPNPERDDRYLELREAAEKVCFTKKISVEMLDRVEKAAFSRPDRFENRAELQEFIDRYAIPFGRMLAGLAGMDSEWRLQFIDELSRGFYYTRRIIQLNTEIARGHLFFPETELALGVDPDNAADRRSPEFRKRMWKESIRAKDHLASGVKIVRDLTRRQRVAVKKEVLTCLEYLRIAEKEDFDVDQELVLGALTRTQVVLQARFGRATFKY